MKIVADYYGMSIWLRAAEDDVESTEGLCGNDNGLREDDVTGGDGVRHAAVNGQIVNKEFMDSWRYAFLVYQLYCFKFLPGFQQTKVILGEKWSKT